MQPHGGVALGEKEGGESVGFARAWAEKECASLLRRLRVLTRAVSALEARNRRSFLFGCFEPSLLHRRSFTRLLLSFFLSSRRARVSNTQICPLHFGNSAHPAPSHRARDRLHFLLRGELAQGCTDAGRLDPGLPFTPRPDHASRQPSPSQNYRKIASRESRGRAQQQPQASSRTSPCPCRCDSAPPRRWRPVGRHPKHRDRRRRPSRPARRPRIIKMGQRIGALGMQHLERALDSIGYSAESFRSSSWSTFRTHTTLSWSATRIGICTSSRSARCCPFFGCCPLTVSS